MCYQVQMFLLLSQFNTLALIAPLTKIITRR